MKKAFLIIIAAVFVNLTLFAGDNSFFKGGDNMTDIIIIPFCFFIAFLGLFLIFFPAKRKKTNIKITLIYSLFFLFIGFYLICSVLFPSIKWEKVSDTTYYANCNAFQKANLVIVNEETFNSFYEQDEILIEMFAGKKTQCLKQKISAKQEKSCKQLLKKFTDKYTITYGVLMVFKNNITYVFLINNANQEVVCMDSYYICK
ncbi:MAG: hypothetical protein MJ159_00435 [Treponemataceae bacterium]|nr:hypothetical protein [Treponemataceae bacterium]